MSQQVFIYGASGHAKVVADMLRARWIVPAGFIDDSIEKKNWTSGGLTVLGDGAWLAQAARREQVSVALGVGDNAARERVVARCLKAGLRLLTVVHPSATVSLAARVSDGVVVMAHAVINPDAVIGLGAIINTGAVVEHDCEVGDFAHLSPNSAMGGGAKIGRASWLGIGAVISHGVKVGANTMIGAGAVVVRDVPDGVVAVGVPARVIRRITDRTLTTE